MEDTFCVLKKEKQRLRYAPSCFTEQGVTMLSWVLNTDGVVEVNIRILRIFTIMKEMLLTNKDVLLQLQKIETKIKAHDNDIQIIFKYSKKLINPEMPPRKGIGFKPQQ